MVPRRVDSLCWVHWVPERTRGKLRNMAYIRMADSWVQRIVELQVHGLTMAVRDTAYRARWVVQGAEAASASSGGGVEQGVWNCAGFQNTKAVLGHLTDYVPRAEGVLMVLIVGACSKTGFAAA
jgi:hypothetical protein